MNPIYYYIIVETVKRRLKKQKDKLSPKQYQEKINVAKVEFTHIIHDIFFAVLGGLSAGFGLKGFLLPNLFIDGGVMGISLIIAELTEIPLSLLIVAINLPFLFLAFSTISKQFAFKSIIAIILLALTVHFVPFPIVTNDKLLIAVFGGFFLGAGIGLAIRGGAVIDGTEILAVFVSRKTSMTIGDVIMLFNVVIFGFAAYVFSVEISLYAMLTYLAASKTVDFVVSGIEEFLGVTIISEKSEEIRVAIIEKLGMGCTIYNGKRGNTMNGDNLEETQIIYTLITRLEVAKLQTEIDIIDKDAFVVMHSIKDAKGGMIKKKAIK